MKSKFTRPKITRCSIDEYCVQERLRIIREGTQWTPVLLAQLKRFRQAFGWVKGTKRRKPKRPKSVPRPDYRTRHFVKRTDFKQSSPLTTKRRRISQRRYVITDKSHIQKLLQKCTPKS